MQASISSLPTTSYLVGAGDPQPIEHGKEDLRADNHHKKVGDAKDTEYRPETVDLGGGAQNSDGGHEAGGEGQGHRHSGQTAAAHQKVLGGLLAAAGEGVIDADGSRDEQHAGEHHVVPHHKAADVPRAVHGAECARSGDRGSGRFSPGPALASFSRARRARRPAGLRSALQVRIVRDAGAWTPAANRRVWETPVAGCAPGTLGPGEVSAALRAHRVRTRVAPTAAA